MCAAYVDSTCDSRLVALSVLWLVLKEHNGSLIVLLSQSFGYRGRSDSSVASFLMNRLMFGFYSMFNLALVLWVLQAVKIEI